jgi:hypothetical protein
MGSIAPSVARALDLGVVLARARSRRRRRLVVDKRAVAVARRVVVAGAAADVVETVVEKRRDVVGVARARVVGVATRMVGRTPRARE